MSASHTDGDVGRNELENDDGDSNEERTITGFDSSTALILVTEPDDDADSDEHANVLGGSPNSNHSPFDISTDSDDDNEDDEDDQEYSADSPTPIPPMSSLTVFLYLLSPFLKFGALLLPPILLGSEPSDPDPDSAANTDLSLQPLSRRWSAVAIVVFAAIAAFTRHIWYMLARYVRRADLEEIVLETFARARGRAENKRRILRAAVRAGTAGMRIVMGVVYVRGN